MALLFSTVALTVAKNRSGSQVYLYRGQGIESASLDPDDAKRLVEDGFLEERAAVESDDADSGDKPATVKEILADVGNDPEKAAAALDVEKARGDDARSSLVTKLEAIVNPPSGD
jgi:hypothetical protein